MKKRCGVLLTLALVLCLLASPLGALAAPGQSRLTMSNFHYDVNGYAGDIELSASMTAGRAEDGRAYAQIEATGGQRPIGKAAAAFQDGGAVLWLDGLTNSYTITRDELTQFIEENGEVTENFDLDVFFAMIEGYGLMLAEARDPAVQARMAEELEAVMAEILQGARVSDAAEEVMVLGEPAQLRSARFSLDNSHMDAFMNAYAKASPGMEMFLTNYVEFFGKAMGLTPGGNLFAMLEQMGVRYQFDVTMWADESGRCARVELDFTMVELISSARPVVLPMVMEYRDDESGRRTRMTMAQTVDGVAIDYRLYQCETGDGHSIELVMDVREEDTDTILTNVAFESVYALKENGHETLSLAGTAIGSGMMLLGKASYAGEVTADGRAGHVTLEFGIPSESEETAELSFDISLLKGPADDGVLSGLDAPEPIALVQMDEAQVELLLKELAAAGIGALGGVLQTPGVAELIADVATPARMYVTVGSEVFEIE